MFNFVLRERFFFFPSKFNHTTCTCFLISWLTLCHMIECFFFFLNTLSPPNSFWTQIECTQRCQLWNVHLTLILKISVLWNLWCHSTSNSQERKISTLFRDSKPFHSHCYKSHFPTLLHLQVHYFEHAHSSMLWCLEWKRLLAYCSCSQIFYNL